MRKLMFTLSSVNAVLNALVIGIFMPNEVVVLYGLTGAAKIYGSRWWYLVFVAVPLLISGGLLLSERMTKKSEAALNAEKPDENEASETESDEETPTTALDEILTGNTPHSDNLGMVFTWFFAIISWVMTGIALNDIENISIILPSIIVIMFSAAMIFMTGLYSNASPSSICGIKLKWLENDEKIRRKSHRFSLYMGTFSGMAGVCLSAWSLVISNNIPNCIAILQLVIVAFILPITYSYVVYKKSLTKK